MLQGIKRRPRKTFTPCIGVLESLEDRLNPSLSLASTPDPSLPGLADSDSHSGSFSADGRYLAFESQADNLVAGETNGYADIFIKDLTTGAVRLISTDAAGDPANGPSALPVFSPDGTMVAFESDATNLVPGDTNNARDVFVKNLTTGAITLISATASGSQGTGNSRFATFSPDGKSVAFVSDAADLLPGGTPAGIREVYLKSLATGALTLESANAAGVPAEANATEPEFTPDGQSLAFTSKADNLVAGNTTGNENLYLKNLATQAVTIPLGSATTVETYTFSPDGLSVAYTPAVDDSSHNTASIYSENLATDATSVLVMGNNANNVDIFDSDPIYSSDGHAIYYVEDAPVNSSGKAENVYILDLGTMVSTPISVQVNGDLGIIESDYPVAGPNGEIAFESSGYNLISGVPGEGPTNLIIAGVTLPTPSGLSTPPTVPPPPIPTTPTLSFSIATTTDSQGGPHSQFDAVVGDTQTPADQLVVTVLPYSDPRVTGIATGSGATRTLSFDFSVFELAGELNLNLHTYESAYLVKVRNAAGATAQNIVIVSLNSTYFTSSTQSVQTNQTTDVAAVGPPAAVTHIIGTAAGVTVYDQTLPIAFDAGNPQVIADEAAAQAAVTAVTGLPAHVTVANATVTSSSVVTTAETSRSVGDPVYTATTNIGPLIIKVGPDQSEYAFLSGGQTDVDALATTTTTIDLTQTTTTTTTTTTPVTVSSTVHLRAVGTDDGGVPRVIAYNSAGTAVFDKIVFESGFTGGVRVATGDVNGDGVDDILTAAGDGGGTRIRIFDGVTGAVIRDFLAFGDAQRTGAFIAAADVNGDGYADYAVTAGAGGGSRVALFDGKTGARLGGDFLAFGASSRTGFTIALGDIAGTPQVVVGQLHGGSQVRTFDLSGKLLAEFTAYEPTFLGGVNVAVADFDGNGVNDIITGAGLGGGPRVRAFSVSSSGTVTPIGDGFSFDSDTRGGVRVGSTIADNGTMTIIAGFAGQTRTAVDGIPMSGDDEPFGASYLGSIWVS